MLKLYRTLVAILVAFAAAGSASAAVPAQFIAKLYTEALGRAPDATGWSGKVAYFTSNPCNVSTLSAHGLGVFNSSEFNSRSYSNAAKLLLLYRTVLDREPDTNGFLYHLGQLNNGVAFSDKVTEFFYSNEFKQLIPRICSGAPYYFNTLGHGGYAISMPGVPTISQASLQASLNSAGPGGTVALPQMAVVAISSPLTIPAGVTLTTAGNPLPSSHGFMARLVRSPNYSGGQAMIRLEAGGTRLTNVWVDGQRGSSPSIGGVPQPFVHPEINIQSLSGANNQIVSNFIANTAGWSSLQIFGVAETGVACQSNSITGNVITAYSSSNADTVGKTWADGISDSCEDSIVSNNHIVDATDAGIVLFRSQIGGVGAIQRSQVVDNIILNAGNSAYVALAVDPLYVTGGCQISPSFAGSYVGRNAFWTGPNAIIEIGIAVGTSEWFFSNGGCLGTGAHVSDNSSNGFRVRVSVVKTFGTTRGVGLRSAGLVWV